MKHGRAVAALAFLSFAVLVPAVAGAGGRYGHGYRSGYGHGYHSGYGYGHRSSFSLRLGFGAPYYYAPYYGYAPYLGPPPGGGPGLLCHRPG